MQYGKYMKKEHETCNLSFARAVEFCVLALIVQSIWFLALSMCLSLTGVLFSNFSFLDFPELSNVVGGRYAAGTTRSCWTNASIVIIICN